MSCKLRSGFAICSALYFTSTENHVITAILGVEVIL